MNKPMCLLLSGVILFISGCGAISKQQSYRDTDEIDYVFPESITYENPIPVENQWMSPENVPYGFGDPFVFRHNGMFYLYSSTMDLQRGIRVFQSADMVNWEYKGYAIPNDDTTTVTAYAPEVVYYNGYFYLCQSSDGRGHRIYKGDSPLGPFTRISGNIGRGIDGAWHIGDDGELYFLHAWDDRLSWSKITDIEDLGGTARTASDVSGSNIDLPAAIAGTGMGGWVEGPGIFRRGDYSYITYTGNHVLSPGYRVEYSYKMNMRLPDVFDQPEENIVLLSVKDDFYGLGHNSNVKGRDLDSLYTAYHNLLGRHPRWGWPSRGLNIDRYLTNGRELMANGVTNYEVASPKAPDYENSDPNRFVQTGDFLLSDAKTENYYTAEFNFVIKTDASSASIVFGYDDENNYYSLTVNKNNNTLTLNKVSQGVISAEASSVVSKNNNFSRLVTVRVESGYSRSFIYFNGMRVIAYPQNIPAGKIGYDENCIGEYTAFSNDVFGTSDFEEIKNLPSEFPAISYLKEENRGFSFAVAAPLRDGVRQGEKENSFEADGRRVLVLNTPGDYVKYAVNAHKGGVYGFSAELSKESQNAVFEVIVDNTARYTVTTAGMGFDDVTGFGRSPLSKINLTSGGHVIKIRLVSGILEAVNFGFSENAESLRAYSNNLKSSLADFYDFNENYEVSSSGVVSRVWQTGMLLFGNEGSSNYKISLDYAVNSGSGRNGIVFRARNFTEAVPDLRTRDEMQGYFLGISRNKVELIRCNYGEKTLAVANLSNAKAFDNNVFRSIEIEIKLNRITVKIDGEVIFDIFDYDALEGGRTGLYSVSTQITASNFKYTEI
jgi:hypothetical protein